MNNSPLISYGFTYDCDGSSYAFHVVATSESEARKRVACMNAAKFSGELLQDESLEAPNAQAQALQRLRIFLHAAELGVLSEMRSKTMSVTELFEARIDRLYQAAFRGEHYNALARNPDLRQLVHEIWDEVERHREAVRVLHDFAVDVAEAGDTESVELAQAVLNMAIVRSVTPNAELSGGEASAN